MNDKSFGATLRLLRERENLSVKDVLTRLKEFDLNITDKTLYSYENGTRAASADMLLALCQIYNCSNILETFANVQPDYSIPDDNEWKLIEKYRDLDPHGKDMVDTILDKEYIRSTESAPIQRNGIHSISYIKETNPDLMVNAAHERTDVEFTEKDRQADEDMLD